MADFGLYGKFLASVVICLSVLAFAAPNALAIERFPDSASLSQKDRADLAITLLEQTLNDPSWFNVNALLGVVLPDQQKAVRDKLTSVTKFLEPIGASAASGHSQVSLGRLHTALLSGGVQADISLPGIDSSGQGKRQLRFKPQGHSVVFTNLPQFLGALDTALAKTRGVRVAPKATAPRIATTQQSVIPNLPALFMETSFAYQHDIKIFNGQQSNSQFGSRVLGNPGGICALWAGTFFGLSFGTDALLISDQNWNRLLYAGNPGDDNNSWLMAAGSYGSGNSLGFNSPAGIDANPHYVYIVDRNNKRLVVCNFDPTSGAITFHEAIGGFTDPVDVASSIILDRTVPNGSYQYQFAVLDQVGGYVRLYVDDNTNIYSLSTYQSNQFGTMALNHPTALCYGRHFVDNLHTNQIYVVDAGNNRIVSRSADPSSILSTPPGAFPADAYLTAIDVDDFGYVYVTDATYGRVYLVTPSLSQVIGFYGRKGQAEGLFWYPSAIAHKFGWTLDYSSNPPRIVPVSFGEFVVAEPFGDATGLKKFRLGAGVYSVSATYHSGTACNWYSDYIDINWLQSAPGHATISFYYGAPGGTPLYQQTLMETGGSHEYRFYLGTTVPPTRETNDTWVTVTDTSIYQSAWAASDTLLVEYARDVGSCTQTPPTTTPRINVSASLTAEDPSTSLPVSSVYGYPSKWWKLTLPYQDLCPDPTKKVHFDWRSCNYFQDPTDSTYFSADPFASSPTGGNEIVTDNPVVYARLTLRDNPNGVGQVTFGLATLFVYKPDSSWDATGNCDPPGSQQGGDEVLLQKSFATAYLNIPYTCSAPGTTCPSGGGGGGGGCPFLYASRGDTFDFVNNLLPQSELDTNTASFKVDYVPLWDVPGADSTEVRLRIREDEQEISQFDRVGLFNIVLPWSARKPAFSQRNELLVLADKPIEPTSAVTNTGEDITHLVAMLDGDKYVTVGQGGFIDFDYVLATASDKARGQASLSLAPGGIISPPPPKDLAEKISSGGSVITTTRVQVRTSTGQYVDVTTLAPRVGSWSQFIDLSDYLTDQTLHVRLVWTGAVEIDDLPFYFFSRPTVTIQRDSLVSATHSVLGSVVQPLLRADRHTVSLAPGQYLDLGFRGQPSDGSLRRLPIFVVEGRYRKQSLLARSAAAGTLPASFSFDQNYPNPFNPSTTFHFALPAAAHVNLEIYNILGQKVVTLINQEYEAGDHSYQWNGETGNGQPASSGVYFARLTAGNFTGTKKMVVVK